MQTYLIKKAKFSDQKGSVPPCWKDVPSLEINKFPWFKSGAKQKTQVKLCATKQALFIKVIAQDNYSFAEQTALNHMQICEDSCVEFFFSPSGVLASSYVNIEVNCCGSLHIAYGQDRHKRRFIDKELAKQIQCKTSLETKTKVESKHDKQWIIEIIFPFSVIEQLCSQEINKDLWYGNFYRCGGRNEPQFASWSNILTASPDYHRPEFFGSLIFE